MGKFRGLLSPFAHRIFVATGILLFALLYLYEISSLNHSQDKLLVNPVIWIIVILYPIIIWQEWRQFKGKQAQEQTSEPEKEKESSETSAKLTKKVLFFMLSTFGYLIGMNYLGFFMMTIIYMPLLMWVLGTKSKRILIILPIATTIILYVLFDMVLEIPLPQGLLLQGVL